MRPHRWQPTRLPRPRDSPGKNTGVGCHFLLQCMKVKSESEVTQSCPTPSDPMDYSLPGSSVRGIFQARVLEWGAIAFSFICSRKPHIFYDLLYWASLMTQMVKKLLIMQETWVQSLGQEDPLEKDMATLQYSCLEDSMDRGVWWATVHGVKKSQIRPSS